MNGGARAVNLLKGLPSPGSESSGMSSDRSMGSPKSSTDEDCDPKLQKILHVEERALKYCNFRYEKSKEQFYKLGKELFPTDQTKGPPKRSVIFAKRLRDDLTVVIKLRNKEKGFKDQAELEDWLTMMKIMFYLSFHSGDEKIIDVSKEVKEVMRLEPRKGNFKHTAQVMDIFEDREWYYVVMEYVQGRDLFDWFMQEKVHEQPSDRKLVIIKHLAQQLLLGMNELHGEGLMHKDIKLENIVMDEAGGTKKSSIKGRDPSEPLTLQPKVIDFDTVEIYSGRKSFHVLGTDQYIAPESYAGRPCPASDVWALGVIFYVLFTGCFPFHYALFDDEPGENYAGHPRMDQIRRRLRIARIDWSNKMWLDQDAKDFVRRCLSCDHKRRLTIDQALKHSFFNEMKSGPPAEKSGSNNTQASTTSAGGSSSSADGKGVQALPPPPPKK